MEASAEQTRVTAGKFDAKFNPGGHLASLRGAPDARIVSSATGHPDRVSTSRTLDATFRPDGGIESLEQEGAVAYTDGNLKAWGDRLKYTASDQMLALNGSPRVTDGGLAITAHSMRINRATGEASASGDVKSTYSDLKAQSDGALLASSGPIHVTAQAMTARRSPPTATYTGDARLWQDANVIEASSIEFNRERRSVVARGSASRGVSTILVQADSKGAVTPVNITASRLTYEDSQRKAHFDGSVTVKGADVTVGADQMDVFLAQPQVPAAQPATSASKLQRIVARGHVLITQPQRRATGEQLTYVAGEDKFVLSGGTPSIFDAEHGKITGVSLTFFRRDDRVLVEGSSANPVVTQTRVAR
jgi:lipopolysaccharide export system protein LptA